MYDTNYVLYLQHGIASCNARTAKLYAEIEQQEQICGAFYLRDSLEELTVSQFEANGVCGYTFDYYFFNAVNYDNAVHNAEQILELQAADLRDEVELLTWVLEDRQRALAEELERNALNYTSAGYSNFTAMLYTH